MAAMLPDFPLEKPAPEPGGVICACAAGPDENEAEPDAGPDEDGDPHD
jgi:hypothetical protein